MASIKSTEAVASRPGTRCYRLTARGRSGLDAILPAEQVPGPPAPYLYDVLEMVGTGVRVEQLRQFVPPRSLEETLRSLLAMGLIEFVEPDEALGRNPVAQRRGNPMFGDHTHA